MPRSTTRPTTDLDQPGASDTTTLIWRIIEGEPGITRDEILTKAWYRIPDRWAKQRYQAALRITNQGRGESGSPPTGQHSWEDVDVDRARHHVVVRTLAGMRQRGNVMRDTSGGYHVLRRPRSVRHRSPVESSGEQARRHSRIVELARGVRPVLESVNPDDPRPTPKEWETIRELLRLLLPETDLRKTSSNSAG
jgi:hypothetical protein